MSDPKIPNYQELMRPVLISATDSERKISEVVDEISTSLGLSDEQRQEMLPSGKQAVIANRVHWAKSYLKHAGLVENTRRGWFRTSPAGIAALSGGDTIDKTYLARVPEFLEFQARSGSTTDNPVASKSVTDERATPDEDILDAYDRLNKLLYAELLDNILQSTPRFFEELLVELFVAMGYGGSHADAGRALGQTGDRGVDGVIDQDPLGVDQIYIQAKRYDPENTVGASDIRDFFGALNLRRASKGIFVTSSRFTAGAISTANDLGSRIVLIDGPELAKLMVKYCVGVREKHRISMMVVDEEFFSDL